MFSPYIDIASQYIGDFHPDNIINILFARIVETVLDSFIGPHGILRKALT